MEATTLINKNNWVTTQEGHTICFEVSKDTALVYILAITSLLVFLVFLILALISFIKAKKNPDEKMKNLNIFRTIFFVVWLVLTWYFTIYVYIGKSGFTSAALDAAMYGYFAILLVAATWILKLIITKKISKIDILSLSLIVLAFLSIPIEAQKYFLQNFLPSIIHFGEATIQYLDWITSWIFKK